MKQRNTGKGIYSRIGKWAIAAFLLSILLVQQTAFAAPPVYGDQATAVLAVAGTTITVNRPANTAVNDLLLAAIATDTTKTITAPIGWSLVNQAGSGGGAPVSLAVFYKVATAAEPASYNFTWPAAGVQAAGAIMRYTGVDPTTPINISGFANGNSTTPTAPTVTTTAAETMVVRIFAADDDSEPFTSPAGHSGRVILESSGTNPTVTLGLADVPQAAAGATGTAAFGLAAAEQWRVGTVALNRLPIAAVANQVNGVVFRDFNANGSQDLLEPGIQNVNVMVIDADGDTSTTTTNANGNYTILNTAGAPANLNGAVRIEFTLPASLDFLQPGAAGATTVQFADITTGARANVGFNNPAQYSIAAPEVVVPYWEPGSQTGNTNAVVSGHAYGANGTGVTLNNYANASQVGTIFGLAYDAQSGALFGSTYIRRGAGVGSTDTTGAIYKLSGTGAPSAFIDLTTIVTTGANPHPNGSTPNWVTDPATYPQVGKIGLGDLEISDDSNTLYTVNLNDRELVIMPLTFDGTGQPVAPAPGSVSTVTIPVPTNCDDNGTNPNEPDASDWRPFALKYFDGKLYVGGVCTAQSMIAGLNPATATYANVQPYLQYLDAHVFEFNPGTNTFNTTPILSIPLDYAREALDAGFTAGPGQANDAEWLPWTDHWLPNWRGQNTGGFLVNVNPQPMLVDIEFDGRGFMFLGFRDRFGDQSYDDNDPGPNNGALTRQRTAGDLLLACLDAGGNWQLESGTVANRICANGLTGETRQANNPPSRDYNAGSPLPEFFHADQFLDNGTTTPLYHDETFLGTLALRYGSGELVGTKFDAMQVYEGGTITYNTANGNRLRAVQMYPTNARFGKAGGLGDVELLNAPAPIELGNRVWNDTDGDGIQDPGEAGLSGVTVTLYDVTGNTVVGTAVTDANGNYKFGGVANTNMTSGSVLRGRDYEIRINTAQGSLAGLGLTVRNSDGQTANNALTDLRDSDASLTGTMAVVAITTGRAGSNNHTLDFGFTTNATADYGDLPDSFDTTIAAGGPAHTVSANLFLGTCVDAETNGQPDAEAGTDGVGGDDNNVTGGVTGTCSGNDDEDGVTLITPLVAGHQACVAVTAVNSTGSSANLYGFIDYNGDGNFDADTDNLLTGGSFGAGVASVPNGGVNGAAYCFDVPASATFDGGETHLRFRLTSNNLAGNLWAGAATNGEVEDYYNQLSCVGNYMWFDTGTTPNVQDAGDTAVPNGTIVDLIWGGPNGTVGDGDDVTYTTTTGSGGSYDFCGLLPNANGSGGADEYQIVVPNAPGTPVTPAQGGNVALDSDGTVNGSNANGPVFTLPTVNMNNDTAANDINPNSYPGSQTDLSFDFGFTASYDWGDLPDTGAGTGVANYNTLNSDNGARHLIAGGAYLGACVDGEADGLQNQQAGLTGAGDDGSTGSPVVGTCTTPGDDEDGVTWTSVLMAGRPASFAVSTSGDSCLSVFIDFDNNGSLDAVSTNSNSPTSPSTALSDLALTGSGPHAFQIDVPGSASGVMYSRFRLTATCGEGGNSATGLATSGEVEDYVLAAVGNFVWEDGNLNGLQNDTDTASNDGLTVSLLDGNGSPVNDAAGNPITTVTAGDGSYSFPGVLPGVNYRVAFTAPATFGFTPRDQGSDDTVDSDANVFDGQTVPFVVNPAATDSTRDAGIYPVTNPSVGNRVWVDLSNDGILNNGEVGIAGATVQLRQDTDANGIDASDSVVVEFRTDSEGFYIFPNVAPGTAYFVCVVGSTTGLDHSSGTPIGNHPPSGTEEDQADGDDGTPLGVGTLVCSQLFSVAANGQPTDDLLTPVGYTNDNADMKIDFGFNANPTAVSLQSFSAADSGSVGLVIVVMVLLFAMGAGSVIVIRRRHMKN